MPAALTDLRQAVTSIGPYEPATLTKWPELGATAQVSLSAAGVSAVVRLVAWVIPSKPETLVTFTLPIPSGQEAAGQRWDSCPVFSTWKGWRWEVDAVNDSVGLTLGLQGVGI